MASTKHATQQGPNDVRVVDRQVEVRPGVSAAENDYMGGAATSTWGFYEGFQDGEGVDANKGNRARATLPKRVAIPTGPGTPFKLRSK